ncbi:amidohydrolase [Feifania hominis]|uniref:Amidohydrolase n=1 Tax=Feifania hominis TaxID=2763660 RepID=A0A926HUC7_9FIRM|nr:amidohydrolase [Feifania hominis]MBC8536779.1 amidohydrolase [Feifania hominis]
MLLTNAKLFTGESWIADGFVETEGEKIARVGPMEELAAGQAGALDVGGRIVCPGFVEAHCHLGLWEDGTPERFFDGNEDKSGAVLAELRALDALNPREPSFAAARAAGVTTVVTGPGSANPIGGQLIAVETAGVCVDDMVVREPCALKMALGENPRGGKETQPTVRMTTAALIRGAFCRAREYGERRAAGRADYSLRDETLLRALCGELPVHIHAHRADDIFTALRLAREFGLDCVLIHCTEGHLIARELAEAGARAVVGPGLTFASKPELRNLSFETPGALERAGVLTAITTDHPETPVWALPVCAALAVRAGMDHDAALRAITSNAAKICGIDGRKGSLRPGTDADFCIFSRDPLDIQARPDAVYIRGERVFTTEEASR